MSPSIIWFARTSCIGSENGVIEKKLAHLMEWVAMIRTYLLLGGLGILLCQRIVRLVILFSSL